MARIDLDDGVAVSANRRGIQIRCVEKPGEYGLARGFHVHRQAGEFAHRAATAAQLVQFVAVKCIGGQAALGIQANADRANNLAFVVSEEGIQTRILRGGRDEIAAVAITSADETARVAAKAGRLCKANLESGLLVGR